MIFSHRKQNQEVGKRILEYCNLVGRIVSEFRRAVTEYIDWNRHFQEQTKLVHKMEHEADVARRYIEKAMFEGAFLPAYRSDYVDLLEAIDKVANDAEHAGDSLILMEPDIPEPIRQDFVTIAKLTEEAYAPVPEAVEKVLSNNLDLAATIALIEQKEREVDTIQFRITRMLFKELGVSKADALVLKMFIDQICSVSNRIENVGDRLSLIVAKRSM